MAKITHVDTTITVKASLSLNTVELECLSALLWTHLKAPHDDTNPLKELADALEDMSEIESPEKTSKLYSEWV